VTNSAYQRLERCYWIGWDLDFNGNKLLNQVAKFDRDETHSFARNWFRDVESAPREQMTHGARHPVGIPIQPQKIRGFEGLRDVCKQAGSVFHKGSAVYKW
jgi:hypothetical protein